MRSRSGMRRRIFALLLIALGVVVLSPVGSALGQLGEDPAVDDALPEVIPENPNPPESDGPELSDAQHAGIVDLLATDQGAQQFLAGKVYTVRSIGPWSTGGADDQLVGALVILELTPAASFPMSTWPVVEYADDSDTTYAEATVELAAENATELVVNVDLTKGRVVGVQPDGADVRITPGPNTPIEESTER